MINKPETNPFFWSGKIIAFLKENSKDGKLGHDGVIGLAKIIVNAKESMTDQGIQAFDLLLKDVDIGLIEDLTCRGCPQALDHGNIIISSCSPSYKEGDPIISCLALPDMGLFEPTINRADCPVWGAD